MLLQYHCFIALIWFLCKIKYIFKNGFKDAIIIEKWCLCDCVIILLFLLVFFLVAFMMLQPFALLGMLLWISLNYLLIFSLKKRGITKFFKSQIDPSFLIFFSSCFFLYLWLENVHHQKKPLRILISLFSVTLHLLFVYW